MKKLLWKVLILVLLAIPCTHTKAATKVEQPTFTVKYNVEKKGWYLTVHHKNPKAVVYYKEGSSKVTKYCPKVKVDTPIKLTKSKMTARYNYIAYVGNNKSTVIKYVAGNHVADAYNKDVKKATEEITKGLNTDFDKALAIYIWIGNNITYGKRATDTETFYLHYGLCDEIAGVYTDMCNSVNVECEFMTSTKADYSYRGNHAWCHLIIDGKIQVVDPTIAACTYRGAGLCKFIINNELEFVKTAKYDLSHTNCYFNEDGDLGALIGVCDESEITRSSNHYTIVYNGVDDLGDNFYTRYEIDFSTELDTWVVNAYDENGNIVED